MTFEFYIKCELLQILCVYWLVAKQKSNYCWTHIELDFFYFLITQLHVNALIILLTKSDFLQLSDY